MKKRTMTGLLALPEGFALSAWIQAGDADAKVPYTQSVHLAQRLSGVIGADAAFDTAENLTAVLDFLDGAMAR